MSTNTKPLARIDDDTVFYRQYLLTGTPVVITGAARKMRAFHHWSNSRLRDVLTGQKPMVRFEDGQMARIPIETFLDYLDAPLRFKSSHGAMYLTDFSIVPDYGDSSRKMLAADAAFPLERNDGCAEWISLYAGPGGTSTEYHQDIFSTHTWLALLRGEKTWHLCAPDIDPSRPHELAKADIFVAQLAAGDIIYLPPDWWHEVINQTATLAISGNFCSFSHAEASLAEAQLSNSQRRDEWVRNWTEILLQKKP